MTVSSRWLKSFRQPYRAVASFTALLVLCECDSEYANNPIRRKDFKINADGRLEMRNNPDADCGIGSYAPPERRGILRKFLINSARDRRELLSRRAIGREPLIGEVVFDGRSPNDCVVRHGSVPRTGRGAR